MGNYTDLDMTVKINDRFSEIEQLFTEKGLKSDDHNSEVSAHIEELWKNQTHLFFRLEYADNILSNYCCNGRETPAALLEDGKIYIRTTLKNYNEEIQAFLDWISPYVDLSTLEGECKYEEWHCAANLIAKDGKIEMDKSNIWGHRDELFIGFG